MSRQARVAAVIGLVVVAVAAFLILRPGDDSDGGTTTTPTTRPTTRPTTTIPAIRVVRSKVTVDADGPVGGVEEIRANAGNRVVIEVTSTGYSGEVHLHGFDISAEVAPGKPAVIDIPASRTKQPEGQGSFELELEEIAVKVAQLLISP